MSGSLTRTGKAKFAISWFFFVTGATLGNWAALLPSVKDEQNISNGELGLILLAAVGGALIALPIVTYFNNTYGSGWSTMGSGIILVIFFPMVGIQANIGVFILGVTMLGFVIGCLDVSANGQAVLCEKMTRAPTLGLFHCVYSMGAFTGAVVGGVIMDQKNSTVLKEVILFGLILLLPGLLLSAWLFSHQEEKLLTDLHAFQYESLLSGAEAAQATANPIANGTKQQAEEEDMQPSVLRRMPTVTDNSTISSSQPLQASRSTVAVGGQAGQEWQVYGSEADTEANKPTHERSRLMERALIFCGCSSYIKLIPLAQIACLALLACFGEGAVNDWSVIYYTDSLNSSPLVSTVGFAGFELSIACGRYGSDYLVGLLGRQRLMMCSGLVACLGMCVVVLAPSLIDVHQHQVALEVVTTIGFSICGFGLSSLAPSAISLAGSAAITGAAGTTAAESIASVTSVSYLGIMLSPPFLGGMSVVLHSLRWSFAIAAGMIAPIALVALCIDKQVYDSYDQGMKPHEKAPVDEQDDRVVVLQA